MAWEYSRWQKVTLTFQVYYRKRLEQIVPSCFTGEEGLLCIEAQNCWVGSPADLKLLTGIPWVSIHPIIASEHGRSGWRGIQGPFNISIFPGQDSLYLSYNVDKPCYPIERNLWMPVNASREWEFHWQTALGNWTSPWPCFGRDCCTL